MIDFARLYDFFINNNARMQRLFLGGRSLWPIHVSVESNFACNLRCRMCYHINELPLKDSLSRDDMKVILGKLPKNILLSYTGGEALLNKDIFGMLEDAKKLYNFSVTTNGVLLKPQMSDFLLGLASGGIFGKGLLEVGISFQGPRESYEKIVGSGEPYHKVMDNAAYLISEKRRRGLKYPLVDFRVTVQEDNADHLVEIYHLAKKLGVSHCNFAMMDTWRRYDRGPKDYELFKSTQPPRVENIDAGKVRMALMRIKEEERSDPAVKVRFTPSSFSIDDFACYYDNRSDMRKYDCYALWSNITISPRGDVVICRDLVIGNILREKKSLLGIMNSDNAVKIRREVARKGLFPLCGGCCALEARA